MHLVATALAEATEAIEADLDQRHLASCDLDPFESECPLGELGGQLADTGSSASNWLRDKHPVLACPLCPALPRCLVGVLLAESRLSKF